MKAKLGKMRIDKTEWVGKRRIHNKGKEGKMRIGKKEKVGKRRRQNGRQKNGADRE